jgi:hypothetical protein
LRYPTYFNITYNLSIVTLKIISSSLPISKALTPPLPKSWLGSGFELIFRNSSKVIHLALVSWRIFLLNATQPSML